MPSKHDENEPMLGVRVPSKLKSDAIEELAGRGLQMRSFVVACLHALTTDRDAFLAVLKPHWPKRKPHRGGGLAAKRFREQSGHDGEGGRASSRAKKGSTR